MILNKINLCKWNLWWNLIINEFTETIKRLKIHTQNALSAQNPLQISKTLNLKPIRMDSIQTTKQLIQSDLHYTISDQQPQRHHNFPLSTSQIQSQHTQNHKNRSIPSISTRCILIQCHLHRAGRRWQCR